MILESTINLTMSPQTIWICVQKQLIGHHLIVSSEITQLRFRNNSASAVSFFAFLALWRFGWLFSSPEPKAQVSYCHSAPSVVRPSVVRPSVNFHIFNFFSRTAWWILMKLGRDEVFMVPYKCCCFSARSAQGRIQGGARIGQRGSPSSRNFFFRPEGYSDKPNG